MSIGRNIRSANALNKNGRFIARSSRSAKKSKRLGACDSITYYTRALGLAFALTRFLSSDAKGFFQGIGMYSFSQLRFASALIYIVRGLQFTSYGLMSLATRILGGGKRIGLAATKGLRTLNYVNIFCAGTSIYIRLAMRAIAGIAKDSMFAFLSYGEAIICGRIRKSY